MYVKKRMSLKDITNLLEKNYNEKISPQALYNWLEKYDLLKYRGKGRKRVAGPKRSGSGQQGRKSPAKMQQERVRRNAQARRRPGSR